MTTAALAMFEGSGLASPFVVPVAGCAMILGIVIAGIWSGIRNREIQSTERLAAIAKGVDLPPTPEELAIMHGKPTADAKRRQANVRLGGMVTSFAGIGLIVFFVLLTAILHVREVLCGAAAGLIPLGIGVALLLDSRTQKREMEEQELNPTPLPPSLGERKF